MIIIAKTFIYFISMLILYDVAQFDISIWSKLVVMIVVINVDILTFLEGEY